MSDSNGRTPSDLAPAYDDIFADHPVNQQPAPRVPKAYAPVSQQDDSQHVHGTDVDTEAHAGSSSWADDSELPLQSYDQSKPHLHCEACDKLMARRQHHKANMHCCSMVATTFIMAFTCLMVLGIVFFTNRH